MFLFNKKKFKKEILDECSKMIRTYLDVDYWRISKRVDEIDREVTERHKSHISKHESYIARHEAHSKQVETYLARLNEILEKRL